MKFNARTASPGRDIIAIVRQMLIAYTRDGTLDLGTWMPPLAHAFERERSRRRKWYQTWRGIGAHRQVRRRDLAQLLEQFLASGPSRGATPSVALRRHSGPPAFTSRTVNRTVE